MRDKLVRALRKLKVGLYDDSDEEGGIVLEGCGSCGAKHHHMCATNNKWLTWIGDKGIDGRRCFDCWLSRCPLKRTSQAEN